MNATSFPLEALDSRDPALSCYAKSQAFGDLMIETRHFLFVLQPDPCAPRRARPGAAFMPIALVPRAMIGGGSYAVRDGQALPWSEEFEGKGYWREYVDSLDISAVARRIGVQEFGAVEIAERADEILSEWPGPLAKVIVTEGELVESTKRHMRQWYRSEAGIFVRSDL